MIETIVPNQGIGQEPQVQFHRLWTLEEFRRMRDAFVADNLWREERILFLDLIYYAGLQPDEAFRIDRVIADDALNVGRLQISGWSVPANDRIKNQLEKLINIDDGRTYLLVPRGQPVEFVKRSFQISVEHHGHRIIQDFSAGILTVDGLCATYANNSRRF